MHTLWYDTVDFFVYSLFLTVLLLTGIFKVVESESGFTNVFCNMTASKKKDFFCIFVYFFTLLYITKQNHGDLLKHKEVNFLDESRCRH